MDTEKQEKIDADKADVKAAADKAAIAKAVAKELSQKVEPTSDVLVKLVVENRENKLNYLVTAGIITPATKTAIYEKLIKPEVLSLILAQGSDDGYDFLIQILTENKTVSLQEKSRQQLLELANVRSQGEENPVSVDIDKRIEKAKQK